MMMDDSAENRLEATKMYFPKKRDWQLTYVGNAKRNIIEKMK